MGATYQPAPPNAFHGLAENQQRTPPSTTRPVNYRSRNEIHEVSRVDSSNSYIQLPLFTFRFSLFPRALFCKPGKTMQYVPPLPPFYALNNGSAGWAAVLFFFHAKSCVRAQKPIPASLCLRIVNLTWGETEKIRAGAGCVLCNSSR